MHGVDVATASMRGALIRAGLRNIVEDREERVKLLLRERIVFVVVAAGAADREGHPGLPGGLDAVDHGLHPPLLRDDAPFAVEPMVAVEARGHDLVAGRMLQHVAGQLFDREPVKRQIFVVGLDEPVAPRPVLPAGVGLVATGVGVACGVEPLDRHPFAVVRAGEQPVDVLLIRVGRRIGEEGIDVGGHRRQPGEVEREPSREGHAIGFRIWLQPLRLELRENESIDRCLLPSRVFDVRHGRPLDPLECPVAAVLGALGDPALQDLGFGGRNRLVDPRRRHHDLGIGARDPGDDLARGGITGHNGF